MTSCFCNKALYIHRKKKTWIFVLTNGCSMVGQSWWPGTAPRAPTGGRTQGLSSTVPFALAPGWVCSRAVGTQALAGITCRSLNEDIWLHQRQLYVLCPRPSPSCANKKNNLWKKKLCETLCILALSCLCVSMVISTCTCPLPQRQGLRSALFLCLGLRGFVGLYIYIFLLASPKIHKSRHLVPDNVMFSLWLQIVK